MGRCYDIGKTSFIVHCIEDKLEYKNETTYNNNGCCHMKKDRIVLSTNDYSLYESKMRKAYKPTNDKCSEYMLIRA